MSLYDQYLFKALTAKYHAQTPLNYLLILYTEWHQYLPADFHAILVLKGQCLTNWQQCSLLKLYFTKQGLLYLTELNQRFLFGIIPTCSTLNYHLSLKKIGFVHHYNGGNRFYRLAELLRLSKLMQQRQSDTISLRKPFFNN